MVIFHSYVKLPEGIYLYQSMYQHPASPSSQVDLPDQQVSRTEGEELPGPFKSGCWKMLAASCWSLTRLTIWDSAFGLGMFGMMDSHGFRYRWVFRTNGGKLSLVTDAAQFSSFMLPCPLRGTAPKTKQHPSDISLKASPSYSIFFYLYGIASIPSMMGCLCVPCFPV